MANERISLKDRRAQDKCGVAAIFDESAVTAPSAPLTAKSTSAAVATVTLYLRPDQVVAIEDIQLQQRRKTGERVNKSADAPGCFALAQFRDGENDQSKEIKLWQPKER